MNQKGPGNPGAFLCKGIGIVVWVKALLAGFLATLVFHQGVIAIFWLAGAIPAAPWDMTAVPPIGVPKVISLAFWGGVWGVPVWWLVRRWRGAGPWLAALVAGAVGPTAVEMLVVFPLKGLDVSSTTVFGGLIVNGAWGIGVVCFMRWLFRLLHRGSGITVAIAGREKSWRASPTRRCCWPSPCRPASA